MKGVNRMSELNRVNRSKSIAVEITDNFQDSCATEAFKGLGFVMLFTVLCQEKSISNFVLYLGGTLLQIFQRRCNPMQWLYGFSHHCIMLIWAYSVKS